MEMDYIHPAEACEKLKASYSTIEALVSAAYLEKHFGHRKINNLKQILSL